MTPTQSQPRYIRRILHIPASSSPNVRLAQEQIARGLPVTNQEVVPGVISWAQYQQRLATWDPILQCIGLEAQFYEGAEVLLYPPLWLNRADELARSTERGNRTHPNNKRAMGVDPAEGGDKSSWSVIDDGGLLELVSMKTPDTSVIPSQTIALMRKWAIPPERVLFDRGGGGKQHADTMREKIRTPEYPRGIKVRTIGFGESLVLDPKRGLRPIDVRIDAKEDKYAYVNRRAEMYGELRLLLDPSREDGSFAIPFSSNTSLNPELYGELRRQMSPIPLLYDGEGRMRMLPKNKKSEGSEEKTLTELIGHSPDELDSLVLAVHALLHKGSVTIARGF